MTIRFRKKGNPPADGVQENSVATIRRNARYVGKTEEVLVEGYNKATSQWIGRTSEIRPLISPIPSCLSPLGLAADAVIYGRAGDARRTEQD